MCGEDGYCEFNYKRKNKLITVYVYTHRVTFVYKKNEQRKFARYEFLYNKHRITCKYRKTGFCITINYKLRSYSGILRTDL